VKATTIIMQVAVFAPSRENPFFYRLSLLPPREAEEGCNFTAPPVGPSPVRNLTIVDPFFLAEGDSDVYNFTVTWIPPEFNNGELQGYLIEITRPEEPDGSDFLPQSVMVR
jgi:hypothetical protein